MAAPIKAPLPLGLDLGDAYTIRIAAVSPTTGADVAGVVISDVSILCDTIKGEPDRPPEPDPPLLAHEPQGVNV